MQKFYGVFVTFIVMKLSQVSSKIYLELLN